VRGYVLGVAMKFGQLSRKTSGLRPASQWPASLDYVA
jgi:hypothetical protein